jgi:hypothetical protein
MDVEHPDSGVSVVRERVNDSGRDEHERSRTGDDFLALHQEGQLALEDVEAVVLGLVRVRGGPDRCGSMVMRARLKCGVSSERARNSTFPTG